MEKKFDVTEAERVAWRARDLELSRHAQIQRLIYEETRRGRSASIIAPIAIESEGPHDSDEDDE